MNPRVSVIVPTYNRADLVGETIDSILGQTLPVETIIVDDGSTDNTREVLDSYGDQIRTIYQKNSGRSTARNAGYEIARGEFICFQDSDDVFMPQKFEKQVAYLDAHPEIAWVYCDYEFMGQNGEPKPKAQIYSKHPLRRGRVFSYLLQWDFIPLPTVLVRKSALETVGVFNPQLEPTEDFDWVLRLALHSPTDYIQESLCRFRQHDGNTGADRIGLGTMRVLETHLAKQEAQRELGNSWRESYASAYERIATWYFFTGEKRKARDFFWRAARVGNGAMKRRALKSLIKSYV